MDQIPPSPSRASNKRSHAQMQGEDATPNRLPLPNSQVPTPIQPILLQQNPEQAVPLGQPEREALQALLLTATPESTERLMHASIASTPEDAFASPNFVGALEGPHLSSFTPPVACRQSSVGEPQENRVQSETSNLTIQSPPRIPRDDLDAVWDAIEQSSDDATTGTYEPSPRSPHRD